MNFNHKKLAVVLFVLSPIVASCAQTQQEDTYTKQINEILSDYVSLDNCVINNISKFSEIGIGKKKKNTAKRIDRKFAYPDDLYTLIGKISNGDYNDITFSNADGDSLESSLGIKSYFSFEDFSFISFMNPVDYVNYKGFCIDFLNSEDYARQCSVLPYFLDNNYYVDDTTILIYSYCFNNKTGKVFPIGEWGKSIPTLTVFNTKDSYFDYSNSYNHFFGKDWMFYNEGFLQFNDSNQLVVTDFFTDGDGYEHTLKQSDKNGLSLFNIFNHNDNTSIDCFVNLNGEKRTVNSLGYTGDDVFLNYVTGTLYLGKDKYIDKDFKVHDVNKEAPIFYANQYICSNGADFFQNENGITKVVNNNGKYESTLFEWPKQHQVNQNFVLFNDCVYFLNGNTIFKFSTIDDSFKALDFAYTFDTMSLDSTKHLAVSGYDAQLNRVSGYINEDDEFVNTITISDTYDVLILDPLN